MIKYMRRVLKKHRWQDLLLAYQEMIERQHRTGTQLFYSRLRMFSLEDGRKQLASYQKKSNHHIKACLNLRSPNDVPADCLAIM